MSKETYVPFHVQKAIADQKEKEKNMVSIQTTGQEYKTTEKIIKTDKIVLNERQTEADRRIKEGENLLIMGPGGTGKTQVANENDDGKTLYIAPTGMAALNLNPEKAMTIHSTLKCGEKSLNAWNWEKVKKFILKKKKAIKEFFDLYDRIVIEEGSMIISGLFNTLVFTFQHVYGDPGDVLFHGKQVIFLMDPLQLPCVKNAETTFLDLENQYGARELDESDRIINNPYFQKLFNKGLNNIIEFNVNMRCRDPLWRRVLEVCRENFRNCPFHEKKQILNFLNQKRIKYSDCLEVERDDEDQNDDIFDMMDNMENGGNSGNVIAKMYQENTKTTLKKVKVQEINNNEIDKLKRKGNSFVRIDREVMITFEEFKKQVKCPSSEKTKLYQNSINYMDDLGGYYSYKHFDDSIGRNIIETEFDLVEGARIMLRTNNVHKMLKNGSLGNVVKVNNVNGVVDSVSIKFDKLDEIVNVQRITFKHPDLGMLTIKAFPIIPAWAITIHKLQGQTLDSHLFIDYNNIPWMEKQYHLLYTAISRCKKHEDVHIISDRRITEDFFPVDPVMYDWYIKHKHK